MTSLDNVSLTMASGSVLAVIGPNGAGKTSLVQLPDRRLSPAAGPGIFHGAGGAVSILGSKPHKIARLGIARTFQNIRLFPALSALENVQVAIETLQRSGAISHMLGLPNGRRDDRESAAAAHALLDRVGLASRANIPAAGCPTASSAASRSRARWGPSPSCCCWTSPRPARTRPRSVSSRR